jgi:hypothetical protein
VELNRSNGGQAMTEERLAQIDLESLTSSRQYFPSPLAWEDQVFYFLMLDRFSDGKENSFRDNGGNLVREGATPLYTPDDAGNAIKTEDEAREWREAGAQYVGGNLRGLTQKIGYLKRLGVTAIWISPIFKQVAFQETYHGYGIQNFLEVEPRFGTREYLQEVVRVAHDNGIYVILDIILNHAGDVFSYEPDRYWTQNDFCAFRVVVKGVEPGNEVTLWTVAPEREIASIICRRLDGTARINIDSRTAINTDSIFARVFYRTEDGRRAYVDSPHGMVQSLSYLPQPVIETPLLGCKDKITLSNLTIGALVSFNSSERHETGRASDQKVKFNLPRPLVTEEEITVRQSMVKMTKLPCNKEGDPTEATVIAPQVEDIKPEIQEPLYAGTRKIYVKNQYGEEATLELSVTEPVDPRQQLEPVPSNGENPKAFVHAFTLPDDAPLRASQIVKVIQTLPEECGGISEESETVEVQARPPAPELEVQELYECEPWVFVSIIGESDLDFDRVEVRVYAFADGADARNFNLASFIELNGTFTT